MIVSLLLAAGASRRFGANKLLVPLPGGTPVVLASARALAEAGAPVLAVLRPGDDAVAGVLAREPGVTLTRCPEADLGMGRSLAHGVAESALAAGWLVALGDMPWVRPADAAAVLRALEAGASIAAPFHAGQRGHPVGFSGRWRNALLALTGDQGARAILDAAAGAITPVTCDHPGVLRDLDWPSDLSGA